MSSCSFSITKHCGVCGYCCGFDNGCALIGPVLCAAFHGADYRALPEASHCGPTSRRGQCCPRGCICTCQTSLPFLCSVEDIVSMLVAMGRVTSQRCLCGVVRFPILLGGIRNKEQRDHTLFYPFVVITTS